MINNTANTKKVSILPLIQKNKWNILMGEKNGKY